MRSLLVISMALLALYGCAQRDDAAAASDPVEVARSFKSLRLMTPDPVFVNPEFATLCVGVSRSQVDAARRQHGPHANTAIRIYMNELAANAFVASPRAYPVGSVIVKEKQAMGHRSQDAESGHVVTRDGVGGMVKRAPGFDPEGGDWEYFYFENPSEVEHGRIESCVQCHRGAAVTDYVFGTWAKPR